MISGDRKRFDSRRVFRHEPTEAEQLLWEALRDRQICGMKFRRQHPVKPYILDFYCSKAQLVIEVDGDVHDYQPDEDATRTAYPEALGHRVLRFRNEEILYRLDDVLQRIADAATHTDRNRHKPGSPSLSIPGNGEGGVRGG